MIILRVATGVGECADNDAQVKCERTTALFVKRHEIIVYTSSRGRLAGMRLGGAWVLRFGDHEVLRTIVCLGSERLRDRPAHGPVKDW